MKLPKKELSVVKFKCPRCGSEAGFMENRDMSIFGCDKCGFGIILRKCPAAVRDQVLSLFSPAPTPGKEG